MKPFIITINPGNREIIRKLFIKKWGSDFMVSKGQKHNFDDLDGFVAMSEDKIIGFLTYNKINNEVEILSLDSLIENEGIGTALLNKTIEFSKQNAVTRLWLITTNDNLNALKFYQKRNWTMTTINKDAVTEARKIKQTIPLIGFNGIPLRHEIEMEYEFSK
jgi:ribosomal protein S18 acetylase RimI-like enzyme